MNYISKVVFYCAMPLISFYKGHTVRPQQQRRVETFPDSRKDFFKRCQFSIRLHHKFILFSVTSLTVPMLQFIIIDILKFMYR